MTHQPSTWRHLHRLLAVTWEPDNLDLPDTIPWPEVAALAQAQGVGPLLYATSQQTGVALPEELRETLTQAYYQVAAANTFHFQDTGRILAALSTVDTPLLLLKGAALAKTLYGNVALRPIGDLDLVVPVQHVPACRQTLARLGYTPIEVEIMPGAHLAYRNEQAFTHPEPLHVVVELHWHLLDVPYYLRQVPMDWFWENAEPAEIAGQPVRVLNAEANLVYLPAHLALHHRFHGLRWFVDLALLIHKNQETLDWAKVITTAQEFELLLVLRETLDRLADYWPSLPLDEPRRRLHALQPTSMERRLSRLLTAEPRSPLLDFYTDVVCLPDLPAKARFILSNAFPQPLYMAKRYGVKRAWELPYWYLYRLGDGLVKLARTLPQALRLN